MVEKFNLKLWIYFLLSLILFSLGIHSFFTPMRNTITTDFIMITTMFVKGLINLMLFLKEKEEKNKSLSLFGALIDFVFGFILFLNLRSETIVLCLIVGFWFLVSGIFNISRAFERKQMGLKKWRVFMILSIISSLLAIHLIIVPLLANVLIIYIRGITFITASVILITENFSN